MKFADRVQERLAVDWVSLAVFRWGLAAIVLVDLILRWRLAPTLLSPRGILKSHPEEVWGLLSLFDFAGAHYFLFASAAIFAVLTAMQVAPRCSAAALLLSVFSLQARNPWILDGGDSCLRWLLLWNLLLTFELPRTAARLSRTNGLEIAASSGRVFSFAGAGLLLQPVLLYLASVGHKLKGGSWREGTALKSALSQSLWERPLGTWIVDAEALPVVLNYLTLAVEFSGPLLLISPYRRRFSRGLGLGLLTLLQLGIGLSLRMNLFPWIMTLSLVPFLPGSVWPRRVPFLGPNTRAHYPVRSRSRLAARISQGFLAYSLLAAAESVLGGRSLPKSITEVQTALGLEQTWAMYSPDPYGYDFGIEVRAKTTNDEVLLIDPGQRQHPFPPLAELWADYRGGMYLENLSNPGWTEELTDLAEWIASSHLVLRGRPLGEITLSLLEWSKSRPTQISRTRLVVWRQQSMGK